MNTCPAALRDSGLFSQIYAKWPASWVLQEAAAAKLGEQAKVIEAPKLHKASTVSISFNRVRSGASRPWRGASSSSSLRRSNTLGDLRKTPPKFVQNAAASTVQAAFRRKQSRQGGVYSNIASTPARAAGGLSSISANTTTAATAAAATTRTPAIRTPACLDASARPRRAVSFGPDPTGAGGAEVEDHDVAARSC